MAHLCAEAYDGHRGYGGCSGCRAGCGVPSVPLGNRLALVGYRIEGDWQWLYTFDGRPLVGVGAVGLAQRWQVRR